ncbi:Small RNA 2'-O-methyltransferase [Dermatophagoides pteronyssinus]|uniref:Small RNA 2'-O-methyltransferase n=1 Tax=Dermatophagoides pteronyssinus TaxID=6956 RepID=A0ABQ8IQP1_DERPT|nr:Small RNA 2'-O-methyltransferase [Dermatophagoides pteronyssinus]
MSTTNVNEDYFPVKRSSFRPPLSVQRYQYVCNLIRRMSEHHNQQQQQQSIESSFKIESVADLGSGHCRLAWYLKQLQFLRYIRCLDLNENCFEGNTYVVPSTEERFTNRLKPLQIELYQGDVRQYDSRFRNVDIVTCIELIEHLPSDTLDSFVMNVFQFIQPHYCIITTPNFDYNHLCRLNNNGYNDQQQQQSRDHYHNPLYRDSDHYFEFTRDEFKQWCNQIKEKYPCYTYRLSGVGRLRSLDPDMNLGYATQIAIFQRTTNNNNIVDDNGDNGDGQQQQSKSIESIQNYQHIRTHYFGQLWSRSNHRFS